MPRPTPAVLRAASILNLLAMHPTQSFSLSDILRAVKINRATLHAVLSALVEAGYLHRANDKSYMLGPALLHIARVTQESVSPTLIAMPEMRSLADEFDAVCSAVFRDRDECVVRERAASVSHLDWIGGAPNRRYSLAPPMGINFMAWASDADRKRWIAKMGALSAKDLAALQEALEFTRRIGFAVGMRKHEPSAGFPIEESFLRLRDTEFLVTDLLPTQKYAPTYLAAPVFDERRQVAFTLVMTGLGTLPGRTVERIGKKLRASCDRITTALAGEFPTTPGEVEIPAKPRRATTARS